MDRWAKQHGVAFAPQKYELIHFIRPTSKVPMEERDDPLQINAAGQTLSFAPSTLVRYLGVWMDPQLRGEGHLDKALARAEQQTQALRGITGATWGVKIPEMVKMYKTSVLPRLMYGCSTWAPVHRSKGYVGTWSKMVQKLKTIQRKALASLDGSLQKHI